MDPVKRVLQPIKKGLDLLAKGMKDMQKLLDNIEDSLSVEKPKRKTKAKKKPARKAAAKKKPVKKTATDKVLTIIKGNSKGVTTAQIRKRTGFNDTKIRGIVYRLKQQGKIKTKGTGVYVKR